MGTCSCKPVAPVKQKEKSLPPLTEPDLLLFRVKLSKFRLRGLDTKKLLYLKVLFGSKAFDLPFQQNSYKWTDSFAFQYETSLERMSHELMSVSMIQSNKEVASMSLELLTIALGPVHQNFSMSSGVKQVCRVSFDAEMLQVTQLVVAPKQLMFNLIEPLASLYIASFKLIADDKKERQIGEYSHKPQWSFEDESESSLTLPVTIDSVRQAALQLKLWRAKNKSQDLLAECWTSFTKLFKEDQRNTLFKPESHVYTTNTNLLESLSPDSKHNKAFTESIWLYGRQVGKVSGLFVISGMPRVYQMLSGVNSEKGPQLQANFILENQPKSLFQGRKSLPAEIVQLAEHYSLLTDLVSSRASRTMSKAQSSRSVMHRKTLHDIKRILSSTHRNTMTCFDYTKHKDIQTAQETMLGLGTHLLDYASVVAYDIQPYYFECLTLLLLRGELDLGYLTPLNTERKQEMANNYVSFLRSALLLGLKELNYKGLDSKLQVFVETMFVIAYFRVPMFRERLLRCFKTKALQPVPEWRGYEFDLVEEHETAVLLPVLDWANNFYASLPENKPSDDYVRALDDRKWQEKFSKRGVAYFRFVERFALHVNRQFVRSNIPWHALPGYSVIVHSFISELKERPVTSYPEALVDCSVALLSYPLIITVFVRVIFLKTSIYDYLTVVETLGLLDKWLDRLFVQGYSLPNSFDYNFLNEGLLRVLRDEHSVSLAKVLLVLYRQMHQLSQTIRETVIHKYLVKENFIRFYCHWSSEVRKVFFFLLEFRILAADDFCLHDASEDDEMREEVGNMKTQLLSADPDSLPDGLGVYLPIANSELIKVQKRREEWVASLRRKASGVYGGFESFPYPLLTINCLLVDKSEQMLELDW